MIERRGVARVASAGSRSLQEMVLAREGIVFDPTEEQRLRRCRLSRSWHAMIFYL